jgi:hypothetical protein
MSSISKSVTVDNKLTLLDLNENVKNFHIHFNITTPQNKKFYMSITTQENLDEGKDIEFKEVDGEIQGEFTADNNIYSNYILCLKANEPTEINVNTKITKIADIIPLENVESEVKEKVKDESIFSPGTWKIIISVIILLIGLGLIYYFNKSSVTVKESTVPIVIKNDPIINSISESITKELKLEAPVKSNSTASTKSSYKNMISSPVTRGLTQFLQRK